MFRFVVPILALAVAVDPPSAAAKSRESAHAETAAALGASASELSPARFARALLAETNRVRALHGRRPLRSRTELNAAADDQAAFMALTMQVQHGSLLRGQATVGDRVRRHGADGSAVAENVASTTLFEPAEEFTAAKIAATLVEQWMNSPGHRETLLDRRLTHFGGSVRLSRLGGQWSAYGVQVFIVAYPPFGRVSA